MNTVSDYQSGNSKTILAALSISSEVNWDLSVKTDGDFIKGPDIIAANNFGLEILTPVGLDQPERFLTISEQLIVDNADDTYIGIVDIPVILDVRLRAIGGSGFLNKPAGNYNATITYTLTSD